MKRMTCWLMCTVVWLLWYLFLPSTGLTGTTGLIIGAGAGLWTHYWWREQP